MRFWQKYSFQEYSFGEQFILFAVADTYDDLFVDTGTETDIFMPDTVKEDLNTEEGSFAIDELSFNINHLACRGVDDEKAMFFCLDAADVKSSRYVAVFFGASPVLADMLFIGKINSKISGVDKTWAGGNWSFVINPKRDYKLSALSFDISILDQCKMKDKIEDQTGAPVPNVYDRFESDNWSSVKTLFESRLSYQLDDSPAGGNRQALYSPLGNLHNVITLYLAQASDIIFEKTGSRLTLEVTESSLGIETNPTTIELDKEYNFPINAVNAELTKRIELKLDYDDSGTGWSTPFIHRKMIDPMLGYPELEASRTTRQNSQISSETQYSFKALDSVLALISEVARSFAAYVFVHYTSGTTLNFEFKSRKGLVEPDYTYLIGAIDAGVDTSSVIVKESNEYYSTANNYANESIDFVKFNTKIEDYVEPVTEIWASQIFQDDAEKRRLEKERKNTKYDRLLLSTSPTMALMVYYLIWWEPKNWKYPLNTHDDDWIADDWYRDYLQRVAVSNKNAYTYETLHNAIYVKTLPWEANQVARLGITPIWRPAVKVYTKINGQDFDTDTLTGYVNEVMARDKHYYETEYSLTVPFWNLFSKNTDGSSPSWNNIKKGSKIKLAEHVRRYNGTAWVESDVVRDYVVVGIERSLNKISTKLKLHNLERFAFGAWSGDEGLLNAVKPPSDPDPIVAADSVQTKVLEIEYGETIEPGDVIMQLDNGRIVKSVSHTDHRGRTIGIALTGGVGGIASPKLGTVQIGGRVMLEGASFVLGTQLFARTNPSATNLTGVILPAPTSSEDLIIYLGKPDSTNSFILDIQEFAFESGPI